MIRNRVSTLLGAKRASIRDLAREAGIAYPTAHTLYHGKEKGVSWGVLAKVCDYFGVQPGELLVHDHDDATDNDTADEGDDGQD